MIYDYVTFKREIIQVIESVPSNFMESYFNTLIQDIIDEKKISITEFTDLKHCIEEKEQEIEELKNDLKEADMLIGDLEYKIEKLSSNSSTDRAEYCKHLNRIEKIRNENHTDNK